MATIPVFANTLNVPDVVIGPPLRPLPESISVTVPVDDIVNVLGAELLVLSVIPAPLAITRVSSPTAVILVCPATWIVLNPDPKLTNTLPEPSSVT